MMLGAACVSPIFLRSKYSLFVFTKCDVLWEDFHQKLVDGALLTLDTYLGQFPDIKSRIAKRSRKLVDYDSARHHLEALQNSKRRDEGRITKAEEEFQKAQKVFEDFNTDLQEELPSLWSRRIGFYVNTFQNVSSLEAKFHKEITGLCHKLYEVMTKLGEQHSDKAFTIQGAPSDSGPLRIAKTPSPPEDLPQIPSPLASPNHTLAPASPAPARPKSPSQLRKGPPVPPLPKLTPSKELQQENIISFFEDNFVPEINVTTPSQNEAAEEMKEESLLDLDFDPFKPEGVSAGISQSHSPMSQTLPWDLWTTNNDLAQPASGSAFNGFTQPDASTSLFTIQSEQAAATEEPVAEEVKDTNQPENEVAEMEPEGQIEAESTTESVKNVVEQEKDSEEDDSLEVAVAQKSDEAPCIPSVVIEPASNHEEEDEYEYSGTPEVLDAVEVASNAVQDSSLEQTMTSSSEVADSLTTPASATSQDTPPGFLFKAEALHDFEAANEDELNLKRGEIVLVVSSITTADQEAGWLIGIRESDWQQHKDLDGYKGLFPENFTRSLE
ncbi:amphiphysin isoform X2 [Pelobates cultripes]|uniref:Amphiphysin isoform X2 n=1 Tax=Pelobates cultripes TaxID=61616 RepID=A0AAD1RYK2_PELCU|nr:amphiphysin isoform X2 [Pelobates cultripes]